MSWLTKGVRNSGVSSNKSYYVISALSHLCVMQNHLCPTGEKKLYYISVTTATGVHEGNPTTLKNKSDKTANITCDEHGKVWTCCKFWGINLQTATTLGLSYVP